MNRSLSYDSPHLLMSNLEPRHTYYIQVAAFTSRGTGPFSETLEVRPEPSLAHLGKVSISHVRLYMLMGSPNYDSIFMESGIVLVTKYMALKLLVILNALR